MDWDTNTVNAIIMCLYRHRNRVHFFKQFFWPHSVTDKILVPQSGFKPVPPAVKAWSLNNWITREVPRVHF